MDNIQTLQNCSFNTDNNKNILYSFEYIINKITVEQAKDLLLSNYPTQYLLDCGWSISNNKLIIGTTYLTTIADFVLKKVVYSGKTRSNIYTVQIISTPKHNVPYQSGDVVELSEEKFTNLTKGIIVNN